MASVLHKERAHIFVRTNWVKMIFSGIHEGGHEVELDVAGPVRFVGVIILFALFVASHISEVLLRLFLAECKEHVAEGVDDFMRLDCLSLVGFYHSRILLSDKSGARL